MNLQQHYNLIGQLLKERPELSSCDVEDLTRSKFTGIKRTVGDIQRGTISLLFDYEASSHTGNRETLWQLQ
jgi:hypothetical protein